MKDGVGKKDIRRVLDKSFYIQDDVITISQQLLGKYLCTHIGGKLTSGMIVETEAYRAPEDRASHAYNGRKTKRNSIMYAEGGVCYVYSCYGLHALFNVVTNIQDIPHAVLIRALEPCEGVEVMAERRHMEPTNRALTSGPGKLAQALGITLAHTGINLQPPTIWIESRTKGTHDIVSSKRIGIDYAGDDAHLLWRFYIKNSKWVSKK
ncbi:MAG: DNA-3-methyladenine glycosylase [Parachlamydiales bacterium]|jgi:DNA-3-methyladenine glycosylase